MKEQLYSQLKSKEEFNDDVDNCIRLLLDQTNKHSRSSKSSRRSYDQLLCECFIQSAVMIDMHRLNQKIRFLTIPRYVMRYDSMH